MSKDIWRIIIVPCSTNNKKFSGEERDQINKELGDLFKKFNSEEIHYIDWED